MALDFTPVIDHATHWQTLVYDTSFADVPNEWRGVAVRNMKHLFGCDVHVTNGAQIIPLRFMKVTHYHATIKYITRMLDASMAVHDTMTFTRKYNHLLTLALAAPLLGLPKHQIPDRYNHFDMMLNPELYETRDDDVPPHVIEWWIDHPLGDC